MSVKGQYCTWCTLAERKREARLFHVMSDLFGGCKKLRGGIFEVMYEISPCVAGVIQDVCRIDRAKF